jgi:hypothetical protein
MPIIGGYPDTALGMLPIYLLVPFPFVGALDHCMISPFT